MKHSSKTYCHDFLDFVASQHFFLLKTNKIATFVQGEKNYVSSFLIAFIVWCFFSTVMWHCDFEMEVKSLVFQT